MNLLRLSWKNLVFKPLSMGLSLLLFALGIGMISLLLLLNHQIQEKYEKNLASIDLVIGAKGSPLQLILCSMYHVDAPTGNISIKEARPYLHPKNPLIKLAVPLSLGDSYKGYRIVGTTERFVDSLYNGEIAQGKLWDKEFEVSVGAVVANELGLKIGDKFHSSHGFIDDGINTHDHGDGFKVVGIFKPSGSVLDQVILTSPQSVWAVHDHEETPPGAPNEAHDHNHTDDHEGHDHGDHDHDDHSHDDHDHSGHDHSSHDHHEENIPQRKKPLFEEVDKEITSVLVRYRNKTNWRALNLPRDINETTNMQGAGPAYQMNKLMANMGAGEQLLKMLALIIVIVSGISIFVSLFSSLRERRGELALMRVMGASRGRLFTMIILEGLLLAIIGYIIGIALSHISMELFARYLKDSYRYSFSGATFLSSEALLLLGALAIGFLAAFLPAIQASKTDISTTLTDS